MLDILLAHIYVTENIKVNIKYQNKAKVNNNNACKADLLLKVFWTRATFLYQYFHVCVRKMMMSPNVVA